MSGLTSVLNTATTGLNAAQLAISVTGENIANVDTTGYSRRTVDFVEAYSVDTGVGQIGSGVWAQDIQRNFSQYVEDQYYDQSTLSNRWESLYTNLSNSESLFNESSGYGLSSTISGFFNAWQNLTQQPEDASSRNTVVENSQTLVSTLSQIDTDLSTMQDQADQAITQQVSDVNDVLKQIAALNKQITTATANSSSDLLDKRSSLVRKLSGYMDINYIDRGNGDIAITTKSGQTLVDGLNSYSISYDAPQTTKSLTNSSTFDGNVYFTGSDTQEYTLKCVQSGTVTSGAGAAQFEVSVDGGQTWLASATGTMKFYARPEGMATTVGALNIWFGKDADPSITPDQNISKDDEFSIIPMKGLYWNENTSTKENISPYTDASGNDNTSRLTGGTLAALFSFKNSYVGAYREKLDAVANSLAWEVNRIHSQGTGLQNLTDVHGTYSVTDDSRALGSASSGLAFGSKLTSGSAMLYVYNNSTGLLVSGAALKFSATGANFNPRTNSLNDVADAVNNTFGTYLTATVVNHKLTISAKDGYSFNTGTDTSGLYAALGLNTYFTGSTCRDLGINTTITSNQEFLATGHVDGAGQANTGDITTASAISTLQDTKVSISTLRGGTVSQTVGGYYNGLVSAVGSDTSQANYKYQYTNALASDLNDQQQSISGVNLDEEMTNLIKYQHAYTAAAKLITTADQMLQTLLALKS